MLESSPCADHVKWGQHEACDAGRGNCDSQTRYGIRAIHHVQAASTYAISPEQAGVGHIEQCREQTPHPCLNGLEKEIVNKGRICAFPHSPSAFLGPKLGENLKQRIGLLQV